MKRPAFYPIPLLLFICPILFSAFWPSSVRAQTARNIVEVTYTYPSANASQVSAKTTIGIRYAGAILRSALQIKSLIVSGNLSGIHSGKLTLALDGRTVIFTPDQNFFAGERVQASISPLSCTTGQNTTPFTLVFSIAKNKILPSSLLPGASSRSGSSTTALPQPSLPQNEFGTASLPDDFPTIRIVKSGSPAPGNLYMDNFKFTRNDSGTYLILMDNAGNILFQHSTWPAFAQDFKPQPNGMYTYFDADPSKFKFYGLDSNFIVVDSFEAANGYSTDSHELIFLPNGGYALLAQADEMVNMSKYVSDGDTSVTVAEGIIQEFDAAKNLIFEWRTRDHFSYADPTHENFAQPFLDMTHCNSIEFDNDSTFILSSRSLDEVTKIDRETGNVVWRWGGKHNQFTFINDPLIFSHQHAVRRLPNGNIIMFDNGNFHNTAMPFSRAVEYKLDEKAKIATQVWEYHHDPEVFGNAMGYVQRLKNGSSLICWGSCDSVAVTEVKPDGSTALEIRFDPGIYTYRAFKYTKNDISGMREGVDAALPSAILQLQQNYPNPFKESSTIDFTVGRRSPVMLEVYNSLGVKVKTLFNGTVDAGSYAAKFDASQLPNGMYFYEISDGSTMLTRTMIVSK